MREWENGCYMIGIGGVSMSALARFLRGRGVPVRGSDAAENDFTRALRAEGIPVFIGEDEAVTEPCLVYTGAVAEDHPQLAAARRAGKTVYTRAEFLGKVAAAFPHVISVSGCHGKTSATSMLAHIFAAGGRPFTSHIGGEDLVFGNYHSTGGEYFLTEACEFRRSFLALKSEIALILNTDLDHTDCYRDEEELFAAYAQFAGQAERTVINEDDVRARRLPHAMSFGLFGGDIRAEQLRGNGEKYSFTVTECGVPLVRVGLNVVGKVMVYNALAAFAAARLCGFTAEEIRSGLENFRGVKRRFERVGSISGAPVVCDYAHHPREIAAVLKTAENICAGTVRLVFQPHTYTRTRDLMDEFVSVLQRAESPLIYRTYAAREPFDSAGSAYMLVARLPEAEYVQSPAGLSKRLREKVQEGDLVLVLGAGDIFGIAKSITDEANISE